jgi:hypothetical protein
MLVARPKPAAAFAYPALVASCPDGAPTRGRRRLSSNFSAEFPPKDEPHRDRRP